MNLSRRSPLLISVITLVPVCLANAAEAVDARNYPGPAWSPYIVGACIGVLSWLTFPGLWKAPRKALDWATNFSVTWSARDF